MVFSVVSVDLKKVNAQEAVKFRGVVTDMFFCYCLGNNVDFEINIDEIISDPSNNLNIGETLTVPPTCENLAYVDLNITVGDRVEVYGIYEKPIDGPIMIRLEESYHYIKKIGDPCEGMNCDQYDGFVGEKYCKNGDVYQKYRDYYCENGECKYREEERKIKDCDYGCKNLPLLHHLMASLQRRRRHWQKNINLHCISISLGFGGKKSFS